VSQQWTFTTDRKLMATRGHSSVQGKHVLHVKGAPEVVLERCRFAVTPTGVEPIAKHLAQIRESLANDQTHGQRTLGLAYQDAPPTADLDASAVVLTWLGYFAVDDPVRPEAAAAGGARRAARGA